MEGALERDDARALGPVREVIAPRHLDGALQRLRTELVKKTVSAKVAFRQPPRQPLSFRNPEQVGDVPELLRLRHSGHPPDRIGVAEHVDGDAGGEIEKTSPVRRDEPAASPLSNSRSMRGSSARTGVITERALPGAWRGCLSPFAGKACAVAEMPKAAPARSGPTVADSNDRAREVNIARMVKEFITSWGKRVACAI